MQKKRNALLLLFSITLVLAMSNIVLAVPQNTCDVVLQSACDDPLTEGYVVMGLSSSTNAHGQSPYSSYPNVLCCNFGEGDKTCSLAYNTYYSSLGEPILVPQNKIISLSSSTNAHAEKTESKIYTAGVNVCYEDMECISTGSTCPISDPSPENNYPIEVLSLSSPTNGHIGAFEDYTTKICCRLIGTPGVVCDLTSASWSVNTAMEDGPVGLTVTGTNCIDATVSFEVTDSNGNPADINPGDVTFTTGTVTTEWAAEFHIDQPNNYRFTATVIGGSEDSIQSGSPNSNVLVTELPDDYCTQITSCGSYALNYEVDPVEECNVDRCNRAELDNQALPGATSYGCEWNDGNVPPSCDFVNHFEALYCGDSAVSQPNTANPPLNEDCDPDEGASVFLSSKDSCGEVNSIFTGGTLGCTTSCGFDTIACVNPNPVICGDNNVNSQDEQCDGFDFGDYDTCEAFGYSGGTLGCDSGCLYDLTECSEGPGLKFCGDGTIDTPNSGNMDEECDTTLPSNRNLCSEISSVYTDVGSTISCSSCLIDVSGCNFAQGLQGTCGDGVINQLSEECDGNDLNGMTCGYLGFSSLEGHLTCSANCKLNTQTCAVDLSGAGKCSFNYIDTGDTCEDGFLAYEWEAEWAGEDAAPAGCTSGQATIECPAQIPLPLFTTMNVIVTVLAIATIYLVMALARKAHKRRR